MHQCELRRVYERNLYKRNLYCYKSFTNWPNSNVFARKYFCSLIQCILITKLQYPRGNVVDNAGKCPGVIRQSTQRLPLHTEYAGWLDITRPFFFHPHLYTEMVGRAREITGWRLCAQRGPSEKGWRLPRRRLRRIVRSTGKRPNSQSAPVKYFIQ